MSADKVLRHRLRETLTGGRQHYSRIRVSNHKYKPQFDRDGFLNIGFAWIVKHMPDAAAVIISNRLKGNKQPNTPQFFKPKPGKTANIQFI